jgi:chromosome segregation protein
MRLTKIKLAGFKSFVDPTTVTFPSNLTGVVGPNGCGKSNVIDAVRWVMGELSAKHLRGDSMADVVFNGSSSRKPVGKASVELLFDNSDGKIGGAYAAYAEVALRREVSRDGSSAYYINGARCRRKDITQLFLGTGLGSRSYAIIEQGMISRVIEAKSDDMRAFVEEAAGISRYKERRKETEARVADTRENLERLQDVRDEVDKQIRHLQRQAATARRYQALKETERRLAAELIALKLRDLDGGAEVHDAAMREKDLLMQSALADLRSTEAAIEKQRSFQGEQSELVARVQGRYFEVGSEITRTEQQIHYVREARERKTAELVRARATLLDLGQQVARDEQQLALVRAELETLAPELAAAQGRERGATEGLATAESALGEWQQQWESFNGAFGAADQTVEVERARIEQLENQLRRVGSQGDRLALEREALAAQEGAVRVAELAARESGARAAADTLATQLGTALAEVQKLRAAQIALEGEIEGVRHERERFQAEIMSLEAVQRAALGRSDAGAAEWLRRAGLGERPRIAEALTVAPGWEHAVETVLGEHLEAVCVEELDALSGQLENLGATRLTIFEGASAAPGQIDSQADRQIAADSPASARTTGATLASEVSGHSAIKQLLGRVHIAASLATAIAQRRALGPDESFITRAGEWVGRGWIRVARGADPHAGVLEREQRLKGLRTEFDAVVHRLQAAEARRLDLRAQVVAAEGARDTNQSRIQSAHREHADLLGQLEAARARAQQNAQRRERLDSELAVVARESAATDAALARARAALQDGLVELDTLDRRRPELESQREEFRDAVQRARVDAEAARVAARDLLVGVEARRSAERSMEVGRGRMLTQRDALEQTASALEQELAGGDEPVLALQRGLDDLLTRRLDVETELAQARRVLEEAERELRALDERRMSAEQRVSAAREAMDAARMAAQETRVRREALAEQFLATRFELADVLTGLDAAAQVADWEVRLVETSADVEKLGQVNLAAIDELKENTERKEYLDRQFADLTSALETLDLAMRRIDKETRSRFEDTFNRINAGMKDKFPRLFGGGHAYLELAGEDPLTAGVAVMARPPGKRNSTISQLSGGEKALTAVALVFSIFDLNPAPFCLLDEVDAPLDENNVGRFCEIVREMAQRVQFIFITHNKSTMELASQLLGVTMNEPGVSRLVAVDVDEALRMAAS